MASWTTSHLTSLFDQIHCVTENLLLCRLHIVMSATNTVLDQGPQGSTDLGSLCEPRLWESNNARAIRRSPTAPELARRQEPSHLTIYAR